MRYPITHRQKQALKAIVDLTERNGGVGCSLRELANELGICVSAATHLTKRLAARGHLRKLRHTARTLQVIKAEWVKAEGSAA